MGGPFADIVLVDELRGGIGVVDASRRDARASEPGVLRSMHVGQRAASRRC
jgi:hypothetical protein